MLGTKIKHVSLLNYTFFKNDISEEFKVVEQEDTELNFLHEDIKNTATYGAILNEKQNGDWKKDSPTTKPVKKGLHGVKQKGRSDHVETHAPRRGHRRGG